MRVSNIWEKYDLITWLDTLFMNDQVVPQSKNPVTKVIKWNNYSKSVINDDMKWNPDKSVAEWKARKLCLTFC